MYARKKKIFFSFVLKNVTEYVSEFCSLSLVCQDWVLSKVFIPEEEQELVKYIKKMEGMLFGLSRMDLRRLAFELAERNEKDHPFDKELGAAGYDWHKGFMDRHSHEVSLRKPGATSAARAMGFNKVSADAFFTLLENVVDQKKLGVDRIWNVMKPEYRLCTCFLSKVISTKGKKQVGSMISAERGQLVTALICCSASGRYIPPMLIFPQQRMKDELMDGAPPGAWAMCHPSGWIQTDLFLQWFEEFVKQSGASKSSEVLLILDGHSTHTKSVALIDLARENGVTALSTTTLHTQTPAT